MTAASPGPCGPRPIRRMLIALTALLGALAGCSDAPSAKTGPPVGFQKSDPFGVLDAFGGADAVNRLNVVVRSRIGDCMKEKGFAYQLPPTDVVGRERATRERNLLFGLAAGAPAVGSFGIAASEATYRGELSGPNEAFLASQTAAYREEWQNALDGKNGPRKALGEKGQIIVGVDGCEPRALLRTFGDLETAFRIRFLTAAIRADVTAAVNARPEVASALRKWSSCAKDRGFKFSDPGEGYRFVEAQAHDAKVDDMSKVSSQESAIYRVFRECEKASRLHATAWPLVADEVNRALARRNEDVAHFSAAVADAARAKL